MGKAKAIRYDYDAAFPELLTGDDTLQERAALEAGRGQKSKYATKEIRSGAQLEVEIYPEFDRSQKSELPASARKRSPEAQAALNYRHARKRLERLINANFTEGDIWATFTYTPDCLPPDMETAQKNVRNFLRRLNRRRKALSLESSKYVYVTECSTSGRWHHHLILSGDISLDEVEKCWHGGWRNQLRRLVKDETGFAGLAHYLTKETHGCKRWVTSKGLKKPEERKSHYKFTRRHVQRMAEDADQVRPIMERWYSAAGYIYTSAEIRYNGVNGRWYVYARLRKSEKRRN